jgi:hypothetical protein
VAASGWFGCSTGSPAPWLGRAAGCSEECAHARLARILGEEEEEEGECLPARNTWLPA